MNVALILPVFCTGGAESVVAQLATNMDRSRVNLHVISMYSRQGHPFEKKVEDAGIPIHYLNKGSNRSPAAMIRLWRLLNELKPDVIHSHMYATFYALPWVFCHKVKLVHTIHIEPHEEFSPIFRKILRAGVLLKKIQPVTISKVNHDIACAYYRCSQEEYPYINNPVERDRFYRNDRSQSDTVNFIIVGRLEDRKNQILAIRAMPEVLKQAKIKLTLLGDGENREMLVAQAKKLGVDHAVVFAGNQSRPEDFLADADVFLMTSHSEGLPISMLEAMAAQLPVISTDVGGISDIVKENGVLIADDDLEALVREMIRFATDALLREQCGKKSLELAAAFDVKNCAAQYTALYEKLSAKQ